MSVALVVLAAGCRDYNRFGSTDLSVTTVEDLAIGEMDGGAGDAACAAPTDLFPAVATATRSDGAVSSEVSTIEIGRFTGAADLEVVALHPAVGMTLGATQLARRTTGKNFIPITASTLCATVMTSGRILQPGLDDVFSGCDCVNVPTADCEVRRLHWDAANGTWGVQTLKTPLQRPSALAVGYVDGDSYADLVITFNNSPMPADMGATYASGTVEVHLGKMDGSFDDAPSAVVSLPQDPSMQALVNPSTVKLGDFNEDGRTDLAVLGQDGSSSRLVLLLKTKAGGFDVYEDASTTGLSSAISGVAVGDVTGDGLVDLVLSSTGTPPLLVLEQKANVGPGMDRFNRVAVDIGGLARRATVLDWDGDGRQDIFVWLEPAAPADVLRPLLIRRLADGSFLPTTPGDTPQLVRSEQVPAMTVYGGIAAPRAVDLDGDCLPELLFADFALGGITVYGR
ncbi:MAG: VCBS repeat-containing protein [Polyangia bacterium]